MTKKEGKRRIDNKYTRREVLKAGAKIGAGATIYGTLGYGFGKGYEYLKSLYQENIKSPKEKIERGLYDIGKKYDNLKREGKILINGEKAIEAEENRAWEIERQRINRERDEKQIANKEKVNRRGFLKYPLKYLEQVDNNPVPTLTITGVAYGAAKSTIRAIPKYITSKKIARLRDQNANYEERIGILEGYKINLETDINNLKKEGEEYQGQIKNLQGELNNLKGILENAGRASGKLETIVEERPEDHVLLISLGLTGLLVSFVLNVSKINGFMIAENISISSISLSMLLFFFSLGLIFIGTMRKKTRIFQKKPYKFS